MSAIVTYAPFRRGFGWAKEPAGAVGTPVAPTGFMPFEKFDFNDKPKWLKDMGIRGSMGNDSFGQVKGTVIGELDIEGACYLDQLGFVFGNILGDVVTTGTVTTPTGTLSSPSSIGATSVQSSVSIPNGTLIQIDVGVNAEIVTTSGPPTGAGPYTIPVPALAKPHLSAVQITAILAPNQHAFSLLNSGGGQPTTHTLTEYYGPAAGTGTRQFASAVFTELNLKWNAESEFVTYTAKAMAWESNIAAATPTFVYSSALPVASWRVALGLGGPASGGSQVMTGLSAEYNIKRTAKAYYTGQGSQAPFIIQRGGVSVGWKTNLIAADESPYLYMRNNTQPQYQMAVSNGLTGANALGLQVDMQQAAFTEAKPNAQGEAIEWDCSGDAVFNTTNAGYSGGESPIKLTLTNAVAAGTYV